MLAVLVADPSLALTPIVVADNDTVFVAVPLPAGALINMPVPAKLRVKVACLLPPVPDVVVIPEPIQ